ncbi:MAG: hypothetical protein PVJ68_17985 [Candidatus Thiodiazotropha sp.]|jgi:hypothetical protein
MQTFQNGQRVIVDQPELSNALRGMTGQVVRLRNCDAGAWVNMDDDIPDTLRIFHAGDPRANHVLLYPQECVSI